MWLSEWFDSLYSRAREINDEDLTAARIARKARCASRNGVSRLSILEALHSDVRDAVYFYLYEENIDKFEEAQAGPDKSAYERANGIYIDPYFFSNQKPPSDYFPGGASLIDIRYKNGKTQSQFFLRGVPHPPRMKRVTIGGVKEWRLFVHERHFKSFPYKLTDQDRKIIRSAASELWKCGRKGVEKDRIISLLDAKEILLRHVRLRR